MKKRNVYIVTRVVQNSEFGIAIPNLGVHTALKRATEHFESIKQDRIKQGYTEHWDHCEHQECAGAMAVRRAYLSHRHRNDDGTEHEELRIELWRV